MTPREFIGVDWSSGAWVAVGYSNEVTPDVEVYDRMADLWEVHGDTAKNIVVDVPIGLCGSIRDGECRCNESDGELSRECDDLARTFISPRASSVFTPPCREAAKLTAEEVSYEEVNEMNKESTGKGLMKQAAYISSGIIEVENLLLSEEGDSEILLEGHPEVCFRAFADGPLQYSKKYAAGVEERLCALENVDEYNTGDWRLLASKLREEDRKVDLDDLLDAIALALTARAPDEELQTLPEDPPSDKVGLPMQMVYRAEKLWSPDRGI